LLKKVSPAMPPVSADATLLVVGAGQGVGYLRDYFGPFRLARADGVVITGAEEPVASRAQIEALLAAVRELRPGIPVAVTTFRPRPISTVEGARVFFATTAPASLLPLLSAHLEDEHSCTVVGASAHLSDRVRLRADMADAAGTFDLLVTELKAAAIDVVAATGAEAGVPTVLCDNVPVPVLGGDMDAVLDAVASRAFRQGREGSA